MQNIYQKKIFEILTHEIFYNTFMAPKKSLFNYEKNKIFAAMLIFFLGPKSIYFKILLKSQMLV